MGENDLICPEMSRPVHYNEGDVSEMFWVKCQKEKCQLWTGAYMTEKLPIYDCAFAIIALKNSDGKVEV